MNERIREVRRHFHLTLDEFGKRICITKSSVSLLESGKNNPSEQTLRLICREFGVSYAWLKDGSGDMLLPPDEDDAVNRLMLGDSDFAKFVFRALAKLPPEAWEMFRQFIENLKAEADAKKSDD